MKLTYAQQLQHPNWQRRRLEVLNAAGWACQACAATGSTLHVHHKQYFKGRMAWEYADHELAVLCKACHEQEHITEDHLKRLLACIPPGQSKLHNALSLLAGYLSADFHEVESVAMEIGTDMRFGAIGVVAAEMRVLSMPQLAKVADYVYRLSEGEE